MALEKCTFFHYHKSVRANSFDVIARREMKQIYIRDKQEVRAVFCLYNAHP